MLRYFHIALNCPLHHTAAVLNLDDTVACTQNYVGVTQFDRVWRTMRSERRHLARRWLGELEALATPLYRRALELNRLDGWSWKFTWVSISSPERSVGPSLRG